MAGGDLHWIWKPYALYQEVDYVRSAPAYSCCSHWHALSQIYGVKAYEEGDGFPNAQCECFRAS